MQLKLVVTNKNSNQVSEHRLEVENRVVIGRHVNSPVLLQGEALSRQHFSIAFKDGKLTAENLSRNGTTLNGESLPVEGSAPLDDGDLLEVPGYEMRVEFLKDGPGEGTLENKAPETNGATVPVWKNALHAAVNFFDPLEMLLVLCALASIALTTYYLRS